MFKQSLFIMLAAFFSVAHAGGSNGGGGNVVLCEGKEPVTIDFWEASRPKMDGTSIELISTQGLSEEEVIASVKRNLRGFVKFHKQFNEALEEIGAINDWTPADLKQMDDSEEPYFLPPGCVRRTAAYRQNPVAMYGDPAVIGALQPAQKGLLRVHEAFYRISSRFAQAKNSISVKELMKALLKRTPNIVVLKKRILELGGDGEDLNSFMDGLLLNRIDGIFRMANTLPNVYRNGPIFNVKYDRETWTVTVEDTKRTMFHGVPALTFDCSQDGMMRMQEISAATTLVQCPVIGDASVPFIFELVNGNYEYIAVGWSKDSATFYYKHPGPL